MIRYAVAAAKHAFGLHRPGRRLPVRSDDVLLACYPDSGDTWARFLIANIVHPNRAVALSNLHELVLDLDLSVKRNFDRAPRPRVIASHSSFDPRYRRVICLVRDPRNVASSQIVRLRQASRGSAALRVEDFVGRFLVGGDAVSPVPTDGFGSWGENVGSWLAARWDQPGFLLVRFEDLLAKTAAELTRMAELAGLAATPAGIAAAIEKSSVHAPPESKWQSVLPEAQVARIETAWGDIMACLGYELASRDTQSAIDSSLIGRLTTGAVNSSGRPARAEGTMTR